MYYFENVNTLELSSFSPGIDLSEDIEYNHYFMVYLISTLCFIKKSNKIK